MDESPSIPVAESSNPSTDQELLPHKAAAGKQKRKWSVKEDSDRNGRRNKVQNMGRGLYFRQNIDKRERIEASQAKRKDGEQDNNNNNNNNNNKLEGQNHLPPQFSKDEIAAEDRKPKRKVAVMIGYSGSGYKGMQKTPDQRTIEGDLFAAFVAAGAISKANADDPKKSGLVRCARTDKGVHAAGNVISLKLIIEDPDILQKINDNLSPQIRVWGIQRTVGSFSCYTACDSRWYEYLIPSHCLLPPHPSSFLGKRLVEIAKEQDDLQGYEERQRETEGFWEDVEEKQIRPILEQLDPSLRDIVEQALYHTQHDSNPLEEAEADDSSVEAESDLQLERPELNNEQTDTAAEDEIETAKPDSEKKRFDPLLDAALKPLRAAYMAAKRAYRIPPARVERLREALSTFVGTRNFHNYTVRKAPNDPSARRVIRSFEVAPDPVIVNDTEWLSLKVHGQSFMMHQIRKMVAMATLVVRCGCPLERITESLSLDVYSIPRAPGLGLLLERPVFDNHNERVAKFDKDAIDFSKYEKELLEFKQREIYDRIFQEEQKDHTFYAFYNLMDNYKDSAFLYLSSKGIQAAGQQRRVTTEFSSRKKSREQLNRKNIRLKHNVEEEGEKG